MSKRMLLGLILALTTASACNKTDAPAEPQAAEGEPQAAAPHADKPKVAAEPAKPEKAPTPSIEDPTFTLALSGKPEYAAAQGGALDLVLTARGGYHVNQEYPLSIQLSVPEAVQLERAEYTKAQAKEFADERASFAIPFKASAGEHQVTAKVKFAVCTPETCVPDERTLALAVHVK